MRSLVFSGLRIPEVNNVEDSLWQGRETNTGPIVNILVDRGNSGVGVVDWSLNPCLSLIKGKNLRLESLLGLLSVYWYRVSDFVHLQQEQFMIFGIIKSNSF